MSTYTVFMRYNPEQPSKVSKYNKEIIEFLNKNIDTINGTGIELRLVLIDEDDNQMLKELSKKGIKKVPALLGKNIKEPIQKLDKIKKFLLNNAKSRKPIPQKGSDEELRDFQLDVMDPTGDEPDDDDEYGDNAQRTTQIKARLEFEKRRRDSRNPRQGAGMTAADMIAQQKAMRGSSLFGRKKPPAQKHDDENSDSDSDDDKPKTRKSRRRRGERGNNIADDPAAIMANERVRDQDEATDKDLMTKFWEGRGVGGEEH